MLDITLSWERGRKPFGKGEVLVAGGGGCLVMASEEHWELGEVAKAFAALDGIGRCESGTGSVCDWDRDSDRACCSHIARVLGSTGHELAGWSKDGDAGG
jgi:hypothetical protein